VYHTCDIYNRPLKIISCQKYIPFRRGRVGNQTKSQIETDDNGGNALAADLSCGGESSAPSTSIQSYHCELRRRWAKAWLQSIHTSSCSCSVKLHLRYDTNGKETRPLVCLYLCPFYVVCQGRAS